MARLASSRRAFFLPLSLEYVRSDAYLCLAKERDQLGLGAAPGADPGSGAG